MSKIYQLNLLIMVLLRSDKNGKLILQEYGKENAIDYTYLYSNFENIDNQYITQK